MVPLATRKRMLFLSPVFPSEGGNGLAMRTGFLLDAYSRHFEIDLAVVPVAGTNTQPTSFVQTRTLRTRILEPQLNTHFRLLSGLHDFHARLEAFREYGQPSLAAALTEAVGEALNTWIGNKTYSLVHVSRLYLAPLAGLLRQHIGRARFILDCDEDDALTHRSIGAMYRRKGDLLQSAWAMSEASAYDRMAQKLFPQFDSVLVASNGEARSLAHKADPGRITVVPNVAPIVSRARSWRTRACNPTMLFVGTLGYAPNADAVMWLTSRVWPRLRIASKNVRLVIAGRDPPDWMVRLGRQPGIVVAGSVPDVAPLYREASLAVVPLRAGGGTRIKLLEAAAWGVPAVSTSFGATGLGLRPGVDVVLADSEAGFARACISLLTEPYQAGRIANNARTRVRRDYDPGRWAARVGKLALEFLA
ncbi:MAG: glycosyltransferase [Bradyrhizobium sp.]|uniref:glycosyltransferase n=1 Tax=Bradyrhizobium sp. TaxID=376 RepID=UPI0012222814|nr:glycosyltransferase [Bradyrhizobium sp.]THD66229.1 MAG: glycosyltransferase [Bradyrhizobium sp.]